MNNVTEDGAAWSFGRRVPLALVTTILIQAGSALVWAGATSTRINALETQTRDRAGVEVRTIRLEEQMRVIGVAVERIETKLDRMSVTGHPTPKRGRP